MNKDNKLILKVLVGSRAHGIHNEDSDYDYRGVFVLPTAEILSLKNVGGKYKANDWLEGDTDQTTYEIGHFLKLATKCNPSILECFKAPIQPVDYEFLDAENNKKLSIWHQYGKELTDLFPYVWNPNDAFNAFTGYSANQRTKMVKDDTPSDKVSKYACAYIRTLHNLESLLRTGDFTLDVTYDEDLYKRLRDIRNGEFSVGSIIDEAKERVERCEKLRDECTHEPNIEKVNDFLLKVRIKFLTGVIDKPANMEFG